MLKWKLVDESNEREGFCCLAVREEVSERLICDTADKPMEYPQCVERAWRETRLLAASPVLLEACKAVLKYHEEKNVSDRVYDISLPGELATLLYDAVAQATGTESDYGLDENDE